MPAEARPLLDLTDPLGTERAWMRGNGRVPRKLTIVVDLPELPLGNETGACVTHNIGFAEAAADLGLVGAAVLSLTRTDPHG